jgi:hypothetical protein
MNPAHFPSPADRRTRVLPAWLQYLCGPCRRVLSSIFRPVSVLVGCAARHERAFVRRGLSVGFGSPKWWPCSRPETRSLHRLQHLDCPSLDRLRALRGLFAFPTACSGTSPYRDLSSNWTENRVKQERSCVANRPASLLPVGIDPNEFRALNGEVVKVKNMVATD